jgi:hypothetical protein
MGSFLGGPELSLGGGGKQFQRLVPQRIEHHVNPSDSFIASSWANCIGDRHGLPPDNDRGAPCIGCAPWDEARALLRIVATDGIEDRKCLISPKLMGVSPDLEYGGARLHPQNRKTHCAWLQRRLKAKCRQFSRAKKPDS